MSDAATSPPVDLEQALRNQVENWRKKLLDLGNRNALINCSFHPSRGVLEIVHPDCETIWQQLAAGVEAGSETMRLPWRRDLVPPPSEEFDEDGEPIEKVDVTKEPKEWNPPLDECLKSRRLRDRDLLTPVGDKALNRRLRTYDSQAQLSLSEQGVHCLYVAFGFLKWFESVDSDVEHRSPLMLVPMTLTRDSADAPWELAEAEDDAIDNLSLRQRLKQDFGLELPPLPDINDLEEDGARLAFLAAVQAAISKNQRWEVEDRCALGRFAFPKVAMWKDLGDHANSVISHPLCRSIGGDSAISPQLAFGSAEKLPDASRLDDEIMPGEVKAILDCDSSQLEAIVAARRGVSFVLDGPPGTGKSQTIANIIADALSEGRKVLFVSEKISALEVVKRRLDDCGLGDFCLECHSSKANRKSVMEELEWCLQLPVEVYDDSKPKIAELTEKRDALNAYVRAVHKPREPLGLSAYELYGQISRLTRLGLVGKSRCPLPNPAAVDRPTFDSWMHLLDRAKDIAEVITGHDVHPWRGCTLLSCSLSLEDDVQHHFGVLAEAFGRMERATRPLIDEGLLIQDVTPTVLNDVIRWMNEALKVPEISRSWFDNPKDVANAVLSQLRAKTKLDQLRPALEEYVDHVAECFPDEAVIALSDPNSCPWFGRLSEAPPGGVRAQATLSIGLTAQLHELITYLDATESALTQLIQQLELPVKSQMPISAIPKVIRLARLISECGTMRPGWFEPSQWTRLRQVCQNSLEKIDQLVDLAAHVAERIPAERFQRLSQQIKDLDCIETSWASIQRYCPVGCADELDRLLQVAGAASGAASKADLAVKDLSGGLGITVNFRPTLSSVKELLNSLGFVTETGTYHGAWRDAAARTRLRQACDDAIADLTEAAEIRDRLQDRLSHRAFKSTGADLARRSTAFQSFWRRWFGGMGAFRRDAAELYKNAVPDTKTLLANCDQLRLYHRRLNDSHEAAEEFSAFLPTPFAADDPAAWGKIRDAIKGFDSLLQAVPGLVDALPATFVEINSSAIPSAKERVKSAFQEFDDSVQENRLSSLASENLALESMPSTLHQIGEAAKICHETWQQSSGSFTSLPASFVDLLRDLNLAHRYAAVIEELSGVFDGDREQMPFGAIAHERAGWERTLSGIEAAERLRDLTRAPDVLRDALCVEGSIDTAALTVAADETDTAYQRLESALSEIEPAVTLSPPEVAVITPRRRTLATLRLVADAAAQQFGSRARQLSEVATVIRTDEELPVDRLLGDAAVIQEFRKAGEKLHRADAVLRSLVPDYSGQLPDGADDAAAWLSAMSAAGQINLLHQVIASDPTQRQRIQGIVRDVKHAAQGAFKDAWNFLRSLFDLKTTTSSGKTIFDTPVGDLVTQLGGLSCRMALLDDWLKYSRWKRDMSDLGFGDVVSELLDGKYPPQEATDVISARFYRQLFDHLGGQDLFLAEFDLQAHEKVLERFRLLDRWEVKAAATQIRQYQLGREDRPRPGWSTPGTSELGILQREIQKKKRHMPLRKLFSEISAVLQNLKPCIMMSPLSVSTFLESDELRFDLVIFDEASQVFPWDAVGAIYRGTQLIVAGDENQLPPTNFFNRADIESDEDGEDIGDFESILSLCKSINMPNKRLRWHYRSRREPLIAFSNRNFYEGSLVTFPSIRDASGDSVRLEFVPQGWWIDRKNLPEAERVADLVIAHLRTNARTSLGVIAFNSTQQAAIEDVIYERRRINPEIDVLFQTELHEPLFIKNLENVQGDERDVILLSMGYGNNEAGKFLKNFGPITKSGGERRLNVAVTRAREALILVASVRAADMDLSGSTSQGSHLLKAYLEYAERGVDVLGRSNSVVASECESPFEEEVAGALIRHGLTPVPQVGCGGFRIDLALKHPQRPGEFCLGIECDGATYHSSSTARDRDRIRQSVLEGLGWTVVRIWSTDWVRNPRRQLDRILAEYESAATRHTAQSVVSAHSDGDEECDIDDLSPKFLKHENSAKVFFSRIDDVPDDIVTEKVLSILKHAGATDRDDLVKLVTRELGFARTGKKIRDRLEEVLNQELRVGSLRNVGDRIAIQTAVSP